MDYSPRLSSENESWKPTGPRKRCPKCGAMVYMPCRACELRKQIATGKVTKCFDHRFDEEMQIDLLPEHEQRYKEIYAKRERAELEKRIAEADQELSDAASTD